MERVCRWFGGHPVITGALSGLPALRFAAVFGRVSRRPALQRRERVGGMIVAICMTGTWSAPIWTG